MDEPSHTSSVPPVLDQLDTDRLRLEPLEPRHAELLFDGLRDDRLYEFTDDDAPASVEALRARYEILARRQSPDGRQAWLNWAVWSSPERRYLGYVQATITASRRAFVAYVLFRDAWGRGYAGEAVERVVRYLREQLGCDEVAARVDVRNRRSIALLRRLGFERVAPGTAPGVPDDATDGDAEYRLR